MTGRWRLGRFEILAASRQLLADGEPVALGARAFDVLLALLEGHERVCTKDELLSRAWPGVVVEENNLTVQVSALRKVLGAGMIVTIPGRGYQLGHRPVPQGSPAPDAQSDALELPDKPSIAVLPFQNLSGAGDDDLCDGITEDVITELARFRSLFVVSRGSSFAYKGRQVDTRTAGRELGVRYVLEGTVRRQGPRVRVTAHLVEAATGVQAWSDKIDREVDDLFAAQEELTRSIVAAIAPQIDLSERSSSRARPGDATAYQTALRAWSLLRNPAAGNDEERRAAAVALAREALARDPASSLAVRVIAWSAFTELWLAATPEHRRKAEEAVALAGGLIARDNRDHHAYLHRALLQLPLGRTQEAIADLRRAVELNPGDATGVSYLGYALAVDGQPQEGLRHALLALRLSPRDPQRYLHLSQVAACHFAAGQHEQACRYATEAIADAPWFPGPWMTLLIAQAARGNHAEALRALRALRESAPAFLQARIDGQWMGGTAYREQGLALLAGIVEMERSGAAAAGAGARADPGPPA